MSYSPMTATGKAVSIAVDAAAARTALSLGSMAVQSSSSVSITGGTISGITLIGLEDVETVSSSGTLTTTQKVVVVDSTSGTITLTLPASSASPAGRCYVIKRSVGPAGAGDVIIEGASTETIDGALNFTLSTQGESITIVDMGTGQWSIV